MRVYIAAPKQAQPRAARIAEILVGSAEIYGYMLTVVSSWPETIGPDEEDPTDAAARARILKKNLAELHDADVVLALTDERWGRETYVEIGRALARGVRVVWSDASGGLALSSADHRVHLVHDDDGGVVAILRLARICRAAGAR
jgi:nucleoside 2-deoxyribosyltransferase